MRFTFLQFLTEKYALDDCDYLVQAKTIDADPHEILTAFLCLDTYYNKYLTNLQSQSGDDLLGTINNIITDICTAIELNNIIGVKSDELELFKNLSTELTNLENTNSSTKESKKITKESKKITKNNTKLKNSKKSDNAEEDNQNNKDEIDTLYKNIIAALQDNKKIFTLYKNIITALPQAASAAEAINLKFPKTISTVYLTGASWPNDVKKFTISKYGMDGYNSSDIIVTDGSQYLGVSLKKKPTANAPDPTIINKSLFNLKVNEKQLKDISGQDKVTIKDMFDTWFADQINSAFTSKKVLTEFIQNKCTENSRNKNALSKLFNKETLAKVNKGIVDKFDNKTLNDEGKESLRNIINGELSGTNSIFNKLKIFLKSNRSLTNNLANQMVDLIFKHDLLELLNKPTFDFALCTGIGKTVNKPIYKFEISDAQFFSITTISNTIKSLSNKATFVIRETEFLDKTSKDTKLGPAKIFLDLKLGKTIIANLEIRFKGTYSSSPQFLGTISEEFKEKIKEIEKPKKSKTLKKK